MKPAPMTTPRRRIVLAGMAAARSGAKFDAVRLQKLFFLVDREIPHLVGGPHFDFRPHHYGPFDQVVYDEVGDLIESGDVAVDTAARYPRYFLSDSGATNGARFLAALSDSASRYMREASAWITGTPLRPLLAAICRDYPDMARNSVVPRLTQPYPRTTFNYPTPSFLSGMARTFDLFGTLDEFRPELDGDALDALATYNDWRAVGEDLEAAMIEFGASGPDS